MKTMKKIAALLAATIMTGMITVPFTASAETSADIPNGWTITYGADTPESEENYATFTTEEAHGGEWSLVAHSPAEMTSEYGRIIISHPAGLPKGGAWDETGKYTVEFYTKGIETSADMWGVRAGTFGHQHETSINGTLVALNGGKVTWGEPDSDGWRKVSFDFAYPYTDTTQSDFKIIIRATPDIRDVYFDDVRVYYTGTNGATYPDLLTAEEGNFEPKPVATGEDIANYGWSVKSVASGYNLNTEIIKEPDGNKMLHVTYNGGWNNSILHRTIATPAGAGGIDWSKYRIYFKAKGTYSKGGIEVGNDKIDSYLRFLNRTDGTVTTKDLGDGWTQYAVTTAGQNSTGFRIQIYSTVDMYLDDFMVVKLNSDGSEIVGDHLDNGSFDNPASASDKKIDRWYASKGGANQANEFATPDSTHTYSGKNAYFLACPGVWVDQAYSDLRQDLTTDFDYSKSYTAKVKVYTPSPNTGLQIMFSNANNAVASQAKLANGQVTDLGNGWYEYSVSMQASEGYDQLRFLTVEMTGGVWIDDVALVDENGVNYIENGSFDEVKIAEFGEFALMDDSYEAIDAPVVGDNIVSVNVNTLVAGQDYTLILAIYKDGSLFDVYRTQSLDTITGDQEMTASITLDTVEDGVYTAKAFLWDGGMNPYIDSVEFSAAQ